MSDLYLVLHRRLNSVADWVELGTTTMKAARERIGLSYEAVARQVPVSSKTYERYEKRGRVPRPLLPKIAEILQLEVEEPERVRVMVDSGVPGQTSPGQLADFAALLEKMAGLVERFEAAQSSQEPAQDEGTPVPPAQ